MQDIREALAGVAAAQSTMLAEMQRLGQQMARSEARQQDMEAQLRRLGAATVQGPAAVGGAARVPRGAQPAEDETAEDDIDVDA